MYIRISVEEKKKRENMSVTVVRRWYMKVCRRVD